MNYQKYTNHADSSILLLLPDDVLTILHQIEEKGYEAFVVGGCVRDSLLTKVPHDWDLTTDALPEQIESIFKQCSFCQDIIKTGLKHGTVTLLVNNHQYEVTTYRIDGDYSDNRHPDQVNYSTDLLKDLSRRDFTINALAYNPNVGIIDCFDGIKDLKDKMIRCVGRPYDRFNEDALRMLRALRFAAQLNFTISEDIKDAVRRQEKLILNVSRERITEEFKKILCSNGTSASAVLKEYSRFFALICPPLYDIFEFKQNNKYHYQDVWEHTLNVVAHTKPDYITRMAALFHDIGKPSCYIEKNGGGHFYGHACVSSKIFLKLAEDHIFIFSNQERDQINTLIMNHDRNVSPTIKSVKRLLITISPELFDKWMDLHKADRNAHININPDLFQEDKIREIYETINSTKSCFQLKDLRVDGNDILGLGYRGKDIGQILHSCLDGVINEILPNENKALLEYASSEKWRKNYTDPIADNLK